MLIDCNVYSFSFGCLLRPSAIAVPSGVWPIPTSSSSNVCCSIDKRGNTFDPDTLFSSDSSTVASLWGTALSEILLWCRTVLLWVEQCPYVDLPKLLLQVPLVHEHVEHMICAVSACFHLLNELKGWPAHLLLNLCPFLISRFNVCATQIVWSKQSSLAQAPVFAAPSVTRQVTLWVIPPKLLLSPLPNSQQYGPQGNAAPLKQRIAKRCLHLRNGMSQPDTHRY